MKFLKNILVVLVTIVFVLLIGYNIYKFVCLNILKKDFVSINGYVALAVMSGSMEPTIDIDDIIVIDTKVSEYKKNDIVAFFDKEGMLVTHRIIKVNQKLLTTKGDNNNTEDKPISDRDVVGKYVFKISKGHKIANAIKKPLVVTLIFIDGILLCIFLSIDRRGNVVLDDSEKEYQEFKDFLDSKNKK